ncbi:hypothetical protein [Advenella sp. S44]|uniref:hypothetical protein n=1 Tax=Advenella sp. S44 TaxID=1982755 RepID=UPI00129030D1|nr:hypothetical protein [Advenella sp. S44]
MSKRKTESQIVAILKEAEVGMPIKDCAIDGVDHAAAIGYSLCNDQINQRSQDRSRSQIACLLTGRSFYFLRLYMILV